jgi:hypothetical protein
MIGDAVTYMMDDRQVKTINSQRKLEWKSHKSLAKHRSQLERAKIEMEQVCHTSTPAVVSLPCDEVCHAT